MIKKLVNIGGIKHTGDSKKDIANLCKQLEKELQYIRQHVPAPVATTVNTTVVASSNDSTTTTTSAVQPKAGIVAVFSVSDQFIPFTGDSVSSYVLTAYFLDSSGQFANIPVVQADQASTGFTLRAADIPGVGMLFYIAVPVN